MSEEKAVATRMGERGLEMLTVDDALRFAKTVCAEGLVPKSMATPGKVLVAMQTGMEVGLSPMRAINSVVVINGAPTWKGDAAVALILDSGKVTGNFNTRYDGEGDGASCTVSIKRGGQVVSGSFSVVEAKRAGLWGKTGPWSQYPKRMLYYRALGFLVRDHFSDVLYGFRTSEEAEDIPQREVAAAVIPSEDPLLDEVLKAPAIEAPKVEPATVEEDVPPLEVLARNEPTVEEMERVDEFTEPVSDEPPSNHEWVARVEDLMAEKNFDAKGKKATLKANTASGSLKTATIEELKAMAEKLETL